MIETTNRFNGMTPAQARVAIAQDVIDQVRAKKLVAKQQTYCVLNPVGGDYAGIFTADDVRAGRDVRQVLQTRIESCTVCAKGSLFIARILRFGGLPVDGFMVCFGNRNLPEFTIQQLDEIEEAFEASDHRLVSTYATIDDRLIAIMEEIAKTGEFNVDGFMSERNVYEDDPSNDDGVDDEESEDDE